MAYVAPSYDEIRDRYLNDPSRGPRAVPPSFVSGTGSAPASYGGSAVPPTGGGSEGRFAALKGFFDTNQGAANAAALPIAQGIEDTAQSAVTDADTASRLPSNYGGQEASNKAIEERNTAKEKIAETQSQGGIETLLGEGKGVDYSPGMRAADAYLYGRAPAFQSLGKWQPVLDALQTDPLGPYTPEPPPDNKKIPYTEGGYSGPVEGAGYDASDPYGTGQKDDKKKKQQEPQWYPLGEG